ncbi:MAG TPA: hypothetical protein VKA27_15250, partial [Sunxiuqinia sp.]|nr:hypothetical protein [Sunxiuqinia sp.]
MASHSTFKLNQFAVLIFIISFISCQSTNKKKNTTAEKSESTTEADSSGFVSIFNGETLNNWDGDTTYWHVENGNLVGEIVPATVLKHNSFIIWRGGQPS